MCSSLDSATYVSRNNTITVKAFPQAQFMYSPPLYSHQSYDSTLLFTHSFEVNMTEDDSRLPDMSTRPREISNCYMFASMERKLTANTIRC